MELQVAINKKDELETSMKILVDEFQKETGLSVTGVDFGRAVQFTGQPGSLFPFYITVTVEI